MASQWLGGFSPQIGLGLPSRATSHGGFDITAAAGRSCRPASTWLQQHTGPITADTPCHEGTPVIWAGTFVDARLKARDFFFRFFVAVPRHHAQTMMSDDTSHTGSILGSGSLEPISRVPLSPLFGVTAAEETVAHLLSTAGMVCSHPRSFCGTTLGATCLAASAHHSRENSLERTPPSPTRSSVEVQTDSRHALR